MLSKSQAPSLGNELLGTRAFCVAAWVLAFAAAGSVLLLPTETSLKVFDGLSFWTMTAMLAIPLYLILGVFSSPAALLDWLTKNRFALIVSALTIMFIAIGTRSEFRLIPEETDLLNIANSLFRSHAPRLDTSGSFLLESFHSRSYVLGSQPVLFSYLTQLLHLFTGVRPENALVINLAIAFALVFFGLKLGTKETGMLATLGILGQPYLLLQFTSGSAAPLFLLLGVCLLWRLRRFLLYPTSSSLLWLWTSCLFFSVCGAAATAVALGVYLSIYLLETVPRNLRKKYAVTAMLSPFLIYPFLCQQWALTRTAGSPVLYPISPILLTLGILALALLLVRARELKSLPTSTKYFWLLSGLSTTFLLGGLLLRSQIASVYMLVAIASALSPVLLRTMAPRSFKTEWLFPLLALNVVFFHPNSLNQNLRPKLSDAVALKSNLDYLSSQGTRDLFLITENPTVYNAFEYGAGSFEFAKQNAGFLQNLARQKYAQKILVIQTLERSQISPEQTLPSNFTLIPEKHIVISDTKTVRISRASIGSF